MRADRWREIEKLFNELAGRPPNEQAAALQRVEPGVRREVEQLLASDGVANASAADAVRAAAAHVADLPKDPVDGFLQPSQLALAQGQSFGRYRILSLLGSGGMGEVYKAHDPLLNRPVAVKVLLQSLSTRPDIRERFQREARAVANLNHPNICMLHDVGQQDGLDYLVMEYL